MNQLFSLQTALCLPAPDIEALIQGRTIAAVPRMFIRPGQQFALHPVEDSAIPISAERYYQANFLPITPALNLSDSRSVLIKTWAKCELCQVVDGNESLDNLSKLTAWTVEGLQEILRLHQHIFLTYLRVYQLSQYQELSVNSSIRDKVGKFIGLPNSLTVSEAQPILSDRIFKERKHQLEKRQPPQHSELEDLQSALASLAITNPAAKQLHQDIQLFLGSTTEQLPTLPQQNLAWINDIVALGDRSIEREEKKSNYQAGTDFENITRRSLEFLGFKVENAYKGGAGGLDLFCSKPYPLVGECKAGKLIPSGTVEELIKLGGMHLGADQFSNSAKLVIGSGNPSPDTLKAAQEWKVSIINAMTLQKLVELKAKYPGAINLRELKSFLDPGQIDNRIDEYIQKAEKQINLRSHLVQLVKNYLENTGLDNAGVDALHGVYFGSNPPQSIKTEEMHEILIELSSPLTGYLGRIKGSDWRSDRFYFLRNLPINQT